MSRRAILKVVKTNYTPALPGWFVCRHVCTASKVR